MNSLKHLDGKCSKKLFNLSVSVALLFNGLIWLRLRIYGLSFMEKGQKQVGLVKRGVVNGRKILNLATVLVFWY